MLAAVLLALAAAGKETDLRFVASVHHSAAALEWLEREYLRRTDPSDAEYRRFLPVREIKAKMAPPASEAARLRGWFEQHGAVVERNFSDALLLRAPQSALVAMLAQQRRQRWAQPLASGMRAPLPHALRLDDSTLLSGFHRAVDAAAADGIEPRLPPPVFKPALVGPDAVQQLYQLRGNNGNGNSNGTLRTSAVSLVQFGVCTDTLPDAQRYCELAYGGRHESGGSSERGKELAACADPPFALWGNTSAGPAGGSQCTEAALDAQMLLSASPTTAAVVDGRGTDFLSWALTWLDDGDESSGHGEQSPMIASVSHGKNEVKVTLEWAERLNTELMKLGLSGRAVFAASGDKGAAGKVHTPAIPTAAATCDEPQFVLSFPASSPYVTAVGATELKPNSSDALPRALWSPLCVAANEAGAGVCASGGGGLAAEQAVSLNVTGFTSGGGFSRWWAQPTFQSDAVGAYLSSPGLRLPPTGLWNRSGRAVPDVAALGGQTLVVTGGGDAPWAAGGTSASAPIFATVWAALDALAQACTAASGSRAPLGPANALLYKMAKEKPECFADVSRGDNRCPFGPNWEGQAVDCATCDGFDAAPGWDPVTGLGAPRLACMLRYVNETICSSDW